MEGTVLERGCWVWSSIGDDRYGRCKGSPREDRALDASVSWSIESRRFGEIDCVQVVNE